MHSLETIIPITAGSEYSNMLSPWGGTIRTGGLVGTGMTLWKEVCHCVGGL